jgi:hypothetical protein
MYGLRKAVFLARHKYGISGLRHEAFGIAVADMVKAGCLVWVPDGGGQTEIVDHSALIYSGPGHASALILAALEDPEVEGGLLRHFERRREIFSTGRFVAEIEAVIWDFLKDCHDLEA